MKWNHRVLRRNIVDDLSGETPLSWGLHEIYYDANGAPDMYSEEPTDIVTFSELGGPSTDEEAIQQLRETLERMLRALDVPILTESDFTRKETKS